MSIPRTIEKLNKKGEGLQMKNIVNQIATRIRKSFISMGQFSLNMGKQIETFIDKQVDTYFENMKTGDSGEDEKIKERTKFKASIVFILCFVIILAVPISFAFSTAKAKLVELTIKSPNEIMMNLEDKVEMYPVVDMAAGFYITETALEEA